MYGWELLVVLGRRLKYDHVRIVQNDSKLLLTSDFGNDSTASIQVRHPRPRPRTSVSYWVRAIQFVSSYVTCHYRHKRTHTVTLFCSIESLLFIPCLIDTRIYIPTFIFLMWTRAGLGVFARRTTKVTRYSTMATPFKIKVEPQNSGLLGLKLDQNEASKVTDLLQKDLEVRRIFSMFISIKD